jgi:hypothetical protein
MAKSACPVTRAEFVNDAKPVEVVINGIPMTAEVKEFSTGSLGWYLNGKANIKVGEKSVSVQIGIPDHCSDQRQQTHHEFQLVMQA